MERYIPYDNFSNFRDDICKILLHEVGYPNTNGGECAILNSLVQQVPFSKLPDKGYVLQKTKGTHLHRFVLSNYQIGGEPTVYGQVSLPEPKDDTLSTGMSSMYSSISLAESVDEKLVNVDKALIYSLGYRVIESLGEGSFGQALLVESRKEPNTYFIMKEVRYGLHSVLKKITEGSGMITQQQYQVYLQRAYNIVTRVLVSAFNEVGVLQRIKQNGHRGDVPSYVDHVVSHKFQKMFIITDVFPNQLPNQLQPAHDLLYFLEMNGKLRLSDAIKIFKRVVKAIAYLHKLGIVHNDLKPSNILIDSSLRIQIIDFGVSCARTFSDKSYCINSGTPRYLPPQEDLNSIVDETGFQYNTSVDVYSLGVILLDLLNVRGTPIGDSRRETMHWDSLLDAHGLLTTEDVKKYVKRFKTKSLSIETLCILIAEFIKKQKPNASDIYDVFKLLSKLKPASFRKNSLQE